MEININLDIIRDIKRGVKECPIKEVREGLERYALVKDDIWNNVCELLYQIDKELGFQLPDK